MELYTSASYDLSKRLTNRYSSSFGLSSRLYAKEFKLHIYAIYALVRIADEIVDTYKGAGAAEFLDSLEHEVYHSMSIGYSTNPIVYAFALTANRYGITKELIQPFFSSMRLDLSPKEYSPELYEQYIHGSAEVVGLMCLRVFTDNDTAMYDALMPAAKALGSAYQKVNFLRVIGDDYTELGRIYFPGYTFETLDEKGKNEIIDDIRSDFNRAYEGMMQLPVSSRYAVLTSYKYYSSLLGKLEQASIVEIKTTRVRIPTIKKLFLLGYSIAAARMRMLSK